MAAGQLGVRSNSICSLNLSVSPEANVLVLRRLTRSQMRFHVLPVPRRSSKYAFHLRQASSSSATSRTSAKFLENEADVKEGAERPFLRRLLRKLLHELLKVALAEVGAQVARKRVDVVFHFACAVR